jgi:predicted nucleic acid-binding protein
MWLLDTNVVSDLRRPHLNPMLAAWAAASNIDEQFISVVTLFEIRYGVLSLSRRDPKQGALFENWLNGTIIPEFSGRTLPISSEVALACAALHVPDRRPERDAYIGATALVHGMTVVTRNIRDFAPMGVSTFSPWEA